MASKLGHRPISTVVLRCICIAIFSTIMLGMSASKRAHQEHAAKTPQRLKQLMSAIHKDLLSHRKQFPWLADYSDRCFDGSSAIYYDKIERVSNPKVPEPQQPDHLMLRLVPIGDIKGFKYDTDFDRFAACKFPQDHLKVYGKILDRDSNGEYVRRFIVNLVLARCEKLNSSTVRSRLH